MRCARARSAVCARGDAVINGEVEPEGIFGQATAEEREALDEEGIEIMDMPWLPKDN